MSPDTYPFNASSDTLPTHRQLLFGTDSQSHRSETSLSLSPKAREFHIVTEKISKKQEKQDPDFGTPTNKGKRPATDASSDARVQKRLQTTLTDPASMRVKISAPSYAKCSAVEKTKRDEHIANIKSNWGKTLMSVVPDVLIPRQQTANSSRAPNRIAAKNWATTILESLDNFSQLSKSQAVSAQAALALALERRSSNSDELVVISEPIVEDAIDLYLADGVEYEPRLRLSESPLEGEAGPSTHGRQTFAMSEEDELMPEAQPEEMDHHNEDSVARSILHETDVEYDNSVNEDMPALEVSAKSMLDGFSPDSSSIRETDRDIDQLYRMHALVAKLQLRIEKLNSKVNKGRGPQTSARS